MVQKPGGIYSSTDYPYSSSDGEVDACTDVKTPYKLTLGGYFTLNSDGNAYNTERMMLSHLTKSGTLSVCLDATTWSTYVSGTISNCDNNVINHCVQVVGIYYSSAEDTGFYKIRNSWGTDWGLDGYVSIDYGSNLCGITNNPMYTDPVSDSIDTNSQKPK
jgi:C1A family cysteine protease